MTFRSILLLYIPATVAAVALMSAAAFYAVGSDRIWERFGPADLGDVDFDTLRRRDTPNDALACRPEFCRASADLPSPLVPQPPHDLLAMVERALSSEQRLVQVGRDEASGTLRYVQRSRLMGYPDTINVKVVPMPDAGVSTVLLYSRSQIGRGDMGVNRARIERWIRLIEAATRG